MHVQDVVARGKRAFPLVRRQKDLLGRDAGVVADGMAKDPVVTLFEAWLPGVGGKVATGQAGLALLRVPMAGKAEGACAAVGLAPEDLERLRIDRGLIFKTSEAIVSSGREVDVQP